MKKIILNNFGDEQEMKLIDEEQQKPIDNQVLIKHMAIGVNFIDIYQRTGLYPLNLPSRLGLEASGVVEAVGDKVEEFKKGIEFVTATVRLELMRPITLSPKTFCYIYRMKLNSKLLQAPS